MTTLLDRDNSIAVEEQIEVFEQLQFDPLPKRNPLRKWMIGLTAFVALAAVAVGIAVTTGGEETAAPLDYRVIGEAEALDRFATASEPAPAFRSIGQAEALDRFATVADSGLTYRALGQAEALDRFATVADSGLTYRALGESEVLDRFATTPEPGLIYRALGQVEALDRFGSTI